MTATPHVPGLNASADGKSPPAAAGDLAAGLTEALGVDQIGRNVPSASVFGRGPSALVKVDLDDGTTLDFERFSDVAKPAVLSATLVTSTGFYRAFKGPEAGRIAAMIHALATHHAEDEQEALVRELGAEFLRLSYVRDVDMSDQRSRWDAFEDMASRDPTRDAGDDRSALALAVASTVFRDEATGMRYVRTGWFQAYARREVGGLYSPAALAQQMLRVGWLRQGSQGLVKASCPTDVRTRAWKFYLVEDEWEVTAGNRLHTRARTHTRGSGVPPVTSAAVNGASGGPNASEAPVRLADLARAWVDDKGTAA